MVYPRCVTPYSTPGQAILLYSGAIEVCKEADRGSKKYLCTEQDVVNAIAYVEYDQGERRL